MADGSSDRVGILERRYSAAEFSALTGISPATLDLFLKTGIISPSIQRASGRGRGHVFDIADVAGALMMQALRIPNAAAIPLKALNEFWHTARGRALIRELSTSEHRERGPRVIVVTEKGVEMDVDSREVHSRHDARIAFSIDVRGFIEDLIMSRFEDTIMQNFPEPLPSGRMPERGPRKRKPKKKTRTEDRSGERPARSRS